MKNLVKIGLAMIIMFCVVIGAACPKDRKPTIRAAIDASYRLPAATNDLINAIREGRDAGTVSADQAAKFGRILNQLARAEVVFVGMVDAAHSVFERDGRLPAGTFEALKKFFDENIVGPFLQVLEAAKVLSGPAVEMILLAIAAARALIRTIGRGFGSNETDSIPSIELPANGATAAAISTKWSNLQWQMFN